VSRVTLVVVPWSGDSPVPESQGKGLFLDAIEVDGKPVEREAMLTLTLADFVPLFEGEVISRLDVRVEDGTT
jgi:hypothetical protein